MKTSVVVLAVLSLAILVSVSGGNVVQAREGWLGPDVVAATNGLSPGEAVITWDRVEEAAYYRIGWVAQADRQVGADGDAKWQEGFVFADAANRGQASHLITGLTPGEEYHFVVMSHDGRIPTLQPPAEVAALRLREDVHPSEYAPARRPDGDADSKLVAGAGVWPSVDFQNSGACERAVGSGTVTMFGEDVNRYSCQDTQGSVYRIFVPVQYTSPDAIARGIHRRANDGMQNRGKRVAIYKALILELAIQKALQDRNHEDVYVDFLQTGRDIPSNANEIAGYVRTGYDLADLGAVAASDLVQHIDHILHSTTLELGVTFGTHAFDVAMAAAVNRTIDIETARDNVRLLEQLPVEDPAWDDAIERAGVDLNQMVSEDALDNWGQALEQNFEEIKRTVAVLIAKKVAVTAVHVLGTKVAIATAPISLTVGLAVTAGIIIFFETGDFWKDLSLASVAAQVYWDTQQHGNEIDADAKTRQGLLDYAQFSFYQHTLQAADNVAADLGAIWNLGDQTPPQFYLSILAQRDLALVPLTGSRWEPAEDFKTLNPDGKKHLDEAEDINQDPSGLWSDEKILWVQDAIDDNMYAYDLESKARVPTRDIDTTHIDVDGVSRNPKGVGIWSDGTTMWMLDTYLGRLYAYRLSSGFDSKRQTWYRGPQVSDSSLGHHSGIGLWSDRTTMWMADHLSDGVYAYVPETRETEAHGPLLAGARVDEKALFGLSAVGNEYAAGIWSDGTTMWVADKSDAKVYAYDLATGRQDVTREFDLLDVPGIVSNTNPSGIWSDGTTMWVANEADPDIGRSVFTSVVEALGDVGDDILDDFNLGEDSASDETTTRVVDLHGDQIFAYALPRTSVPAEAIPFRRNPAKDFARMASAGNDRAEGIWSDGQTMWVADQDDDRVYAYRVSDGARADPQSEEFHLAGSGSFGGQDHATGIWSDGATIWIADHDDDHIYAYRLSDGARVEDEEYDLNQPSVHAEYATGIWFDGTNGRMWVADRLAGKIYGFDANSKELVGTIDALDCAGNHDPQGIWSDGATMWVADDDDGRIYAYSIGDNLRDPGKEFNTLKAANNNDARGIWSDGRTTMWVADQDKNWIYAYNMPELFLSTPAPAVLGNPSHLVVGPAGLHGVVTLNWRPAANANIHRIYLTNADGTENRYWDFDLCGDANAAMIGLRHRDQEYRFRVIAGLRGTDGNIQWSDGSEWSYPILGDGFSHATIPSLGNPTDLTAANADQTSEISLSWTPAANARFHQVYVEKADGTDGRYWPDDAFVTIDGYTDSAVITGLEVGQSYWFWVRAGQMQADGTTRWSEWSDPAQAVVSGAATSPAGEPFARNAAEDFDGLGGTGNARPWGIWSDGITMWISDEHDAMVYAYNMATKARVPDKDLDELAVSILLDIWSDGSTLWLTRYGHARIYAYDLATQERVADQDFHALSAAGNGIPTGLWSDGEIMWVADAIDDKIYAYDMATKARIIGQEFDTLRAAGNNYPEGIWSDGTTMWVSDGTGKVFAYSMRNRERMPDQEFNTQNAVGHNSPRGLWSDGVTMWVSGWDDGKIYAYHMPRGSAGALSPLGNPTNLAAAPGSQSGEVALSWSPAANATVQWVYLVKPDGTDGRYWPHALAGDAATLAVTGLDAGETYLFLVIAGQEQADGTTRWSEWSNWGRAIPAVVSPLVTEEATFTAISSGASHTCGLRSNGSVACWGRNEYDQATVPAGETFTAISSGVSHTCGLRSNGSVACWGRNEYDQATPPAGETFTAISSGARHTCGLRSNGSVACWGKDTDRYGSFAGQSSPPSDETFTAISGGGDHTCGLRSDGTVRCWGWRSFGASSPPGEAFGSLSDHSYWHTCGLRDDGSASCWGLNNRGQASPPSGVSFTAITSGDVHTCGLQPSGAVTCWGSNHKWSGSPYYGQATPPQDQTFVAISAGYNHVCGITTAEAVVCWGDDTYGQSTPPAELSSNTLSSTAPDLVVRSASVSDSNVEAGDTFTFSATVYNRGDATADSTTLRYYRSTNPTVTARDAEVSTDRVGSLDPTDRSDESERLTAPSSAGTYYYGACVDPVGGESNTGNNCSSSVRVTVTAAAQGVPDLVVYSPSVYDKVFDPGERFDMSFWVQQPRRRRLHQPPTPLSSTTDPATLPSVPSDTELAHSDWNCTGVGPIAASAQKTE